MKFSTKTRYGIRAMLEIAFEEDNGGVFQKDIAENQDISLKYLDHIIHALKAHGLIANLKGKKSGYVLTREASKISIYDIHNAFENGIAVIDCLAENVCCEMEKECYTKNFWKGLNDIVIDYFKATSLQDLIDSKVTLDELEQL